MRTTAFAAVVCFLTLASHGALTSPVSITSFSGGTAVWTNQVPAPAPVFGIVRSGAVTGAWTHVFSVTNQFTAGLTNPAPADPIAFYQVSWRYQEDSPMVFNYTFDEGYGFPAVQGQLRLRSNLFFTQVEPGSYDLYDVGMLDELHPIGAGNFATGFVIWQLPAHSIILNFTPGPERIYLSGTMQVGQVNGRAVYTGFSGTVYLSGFGTTELGSFTATRVP